MLRCYDIKYSLQGLFEENFATAQAKKRDRRLPKHQYKRKFDRFALELLCLITTSLLLAHSASADKNMKNCMYERS